ncbi:DUF2163 domain-containing protein [Mesorhizobium sp. M1409]|uniref:baseplate hub domain-containing protein n=1 Tax=Mesorhizobium sp. M1409 TaxID=2957100 RepID=UPI003334D53F
MRDDWPPALVANLASKEVTRCFLIEMDNGITPVVRLTDHDVDKTVGDDVFLHSPGFTVTKFTVAHGGRPAGIDFDLPFDGDGPLYSDDIKRGVWRGAVITVWLALHTDPSVRAILIAGFVGKTGFNDRIAGSIEIATQADAFADIILPTVQPKCWYHLGTDPCPVDLGPLTSAATVATVTSNSQFTITTAGALGYTHGVATFTSGANAGAKENIRLWVPGTGTIHMVKGFPLDIEVGDTLTISPGCAQTRAACFAYGAIHRYPGQDNTPGELLGTA